MASYNELYPYRKSEPKPVVDELDWRIDEVGSASDRILARFYGALTKSDRWDLDRLGIDIVHDFRPIGFPTGAAFGYYQR